MLKGQFSGSGLVLMLWEKADLQSYHGRGRKSNPHLQLEREENMDDFCSACSEKFAGSLLHSEAVVTVRFKNKKSELPRCLESEESCYLGTLARTGRFNEPLPE